MRVRRVGGSTARTTVGHMTRRSDQRADPGQGPARAQCSEGNRSIEARLRRELNASPVARILHSPGDLVE